MQNLATQDPQVRKLETETSSLLIQAKQFQVKNVEQYQAAGTELIRIKGIRKQVDELFDPVVKQAYEAHKATVAAKKKLTTPLDQAEDAIKRALLLYNQEQQKKAREEEYSLRKIAEEQAAREREKLLKQAEKAMDQGNDLKAETLMEKADQVMAFTPLVTPQVQKMEGISTRKSWKAVVEDPQLVPAYFNGIEIRVIQQNALNKLAQMSAGNVRIPGVKFVVEETLAAKAI